MSLFLAKRDKFNRSGQILLLRGNNGLTLVALEIVLLFCLIFPIGLMACQFMLLYQESQQIQGAVDSAALDTAVKISDITIDDPHFGFVALSCAPPVNPKYQTRSGFPAPVEGINELIGTLRLDMLLAEQLGNNRFRQLVLEDLTQAKATIVSLNKALAEGISPNQVPLKTVDAYKSGKEILISNLSSKLSYGTATVESYEVSIGGLKHGIGTNVPVPLPLSEARCPKLSMNGNYYKPGVDIPVSKEHFVFACVSNTPNLSPAEDFINLPDDVPMSVVKVQATVRLKQPLKIVPFLGEISVNYVACAKARALPDVTPPGVLTVQFVNGQINQINTLRDLIAAAGVSSKFCEIYQAIQGNYPDDVPSSLQASNTQNFTAGDIFVMSIYDWIRNSHVHPNLKSLNQFLDYHFAQTDQRMVTIFEFAANQQLISHTCPKSPFSPNIVSENQLLAQCNETMDFPCEMIIRDEVHYLGNTSGGKEAGLPICAQVINWCDLPEFGGGKLEAAQAGKGSKVLGISVTNAYDGYRETSTLLPNDRIFTDLAGKPLTVQLRPSYYSGGLAVDISFGSRAR